MAYHNSTNIKYMERFSKFYILCQLFGSPGG